MSQASEPQFPSYPPDYAQNGNSGFWFMLLLMLVGGGLLIWFVVRPLALDVGGSEAPLATLELQPLTRGSSDVTLADLKGKVALVNFWGTWCPPCRHEFPDIEALEQKYRSNEEVRVLAVSCSGGGHEDLQQLRSTTQAFLDKHNSNMPNYADPDQVTRTAVRDAIGFRGYPTTVLIDRTGKIRDHWVGATSGAVMEKAIENVLAEK